MSLQKIINVSETLNIDRRKVVGVQYSRSEIAKVSETPTRNPWKFTLGVSAGLQYGDYRDVLEELDRLDRRYTEVVSFSAANGASPGLSYMFAYQGVLTALQIAALTVTSFVGNQLVLGNLPAANQVGGASAVLFKKGDFIQIVGYPNPFTATADVLRGADATVTVPTHRPNFISASVAGLGIKVGNDVQFKVFCSNMPTYKLSPGGRNALITWSSEFVLYEWVGDV